MSTTAKHLLIGSMAACSGKSATILGLAHQFQQRGLTMTYAKPLGDCPSTLQQDEDVVLVSQALHLSADRIYQPLLYLDQASINKRLSGQDQNDYRAALSAYLETRGEQLVLVEAPASLGTGRLFDLATQQMAEVLQAGVVLVYRFDGQPTVDNLLAAKRELGDRLLGVLIGDVPKADWQYAEAVIRPYLEEQGIAVFGLMPRNNILRSVSVRELVYQLKAELLCRGDRLDLMVESLAIGAMNVNAAMKYFRKGSNMAIVTGGDRSDIQLAALETSTNCLILTGQIAPQPFILNRAEELEIPVISVDLDTLTTVEIINHAFGRVRVQEKIKITCIQQMMDKYFDCDRLLAKLNIDCK